MDGLVPAPVQEQYHWTEYGIPIRNLWYMLLYGWGVPPLTRLGDFQDIEDAPSLDALLASVLVKLVQQRLRIGLGRNYVRENQRIKGIRGRIKFTDSLKHQTFEYGQAFCEFDQYSLNVPKNQIVRSTLSRLIQVGQFGVDHNKASELRQNIRRVINIMEGIELIELKPDIIRRQQLGRNDRDYMLMMAICELFLERQMPTYQAGDSRLPSIDHVALTMYKVYENFVAGFYEFHLKNWLVARQSYISWHETSKNKYLPAMQPDLILVERKTGKRIVLDTKFTAGSLITDSWGGKSFASSHLYQIYTYLKTQEHLSEQHRLASGILLYPVAREGRISEKILLQGQTIRVETVDMTAPWQDIEHSLLDLIGVPIADDI